MRISTDIIVIGLLTGLAYAVLAAGLVLVYRGARVVNFAHGQVGSLAAAVLARLVLVYGWSYWTAFAAAVALGVFVGVAVELTVVRRLFKAPRLVVLIATIGVAQLLLLFESLLPNIITNARYPSPLDRTLVIGSLIIRSEHFMVLAFIPAALVGLTLFLNRTPIGTAIRGAAENPDAAALVGVSPKKVSLIVWAVAGGLAALTAVLVAPMRPTQIGLASEALGPGLFLRTLTAALVGRLVSVPLALVGGVVIGVAEALLFANVTPPGVVDAVLFVAVLVLIVTRTSASKDDDGAWAVTSQVAPIPAALRDLWWVRRLPHLGMAAGLVVAVALPFVIGDSANVFLLSRVLVFGIIALSVSILIGWAGQLSLGHFAFVGLGALTTGALVAHGMPFTAAVGYATAAGGLAALLVGYPALRVRGLFLGVATLAFAVAAANYFFSRPVFVGNATFASVPRGTLLGVDLSSERAYYFVVLGGFVAVVLLITRLRRSGVGRCIIAVRDNENGAASFGVPPAATKLTAFVVSGGVAAFAGALLAGLQVQFSPMSFGPAESLTAVGMVIIGGLGTVTGALLGALFVVGLPALFGGGTEARLMTSSVGLLVLLLYVPGGLAQVVFGMRNALFGWLARKVDAPAPVARPDVALAPPAARAAHPMADEAALPLRCVDVSVRFGGRAAVDAVSIEVGTNEIVGLIGSNGAGKSTLMNVVSGFVRPSSGAVELFGTDVTGMPEHERARLGMGRVFQDARLFPELTVRETVLVALEGREHSEVVPSMLGLRPSRRAEAAKAVAADEFVGFLGLGRYADTRVSDLSTGTRRIVEMTCLLAQGARLLLLDEPMAGIAQREAEAFAPLITRIKDELRASILVIEHDMPLVMSISDRIYCLSAGALIAHGPPEHVRDDPKVVAAYLGTDERAVRRSGRTAVRRTRATAASAPARVS